MSLNIKNEETHRLVRELAEATGESMTTAVTEAVRERLRRVQRERGSGERRRRMEEISADAARRLAGKLTGPDPALDLYDDRGLPR